MNKMLLALVVMFATLVCETGCNKSGTDDQGKGDSKKAEDRKPTDPKPSQDKKPQELIVGRWEGADSKGQPCAVEFTAFGTVKTVRPDRGSGKVLV